MTRIHDAMGAPVAHLESDELQKMIVLKQTPGHDGKTGQERTPFGYLGKFSVGYEAQDAALTIHFEEMHTTTHAASYLQVLDPSSEALVIPNPSCPGAPFYWSQKHIIYTGTSNEVITSQNLLRRILQIPLDRVGKDDRIRILNQQLKKFEDDVLPQYDLMEESRRNVIATVRNNLTPILDSSMAYDSGVATALGMLETTCMAALTNELVRRPMKRQPDPGAVPRDATGPHRQSEPSKDVGNLVQSVGRYMRGQMNSVARPIPAPPPPPLPPPPPPPPPTIDSRVKSLSDTSKSFANITGRLQPRPMSHDDRARVAIANGSVKDLDAVLRIWPLDDLYKQPSRANVDTLLEYACRHDNPEVVALLLERSPLLWESNPPRNLAPLHLSAARGNEAIVKILLSAKQANREYCFDPNSLAAPSGLTPLSLAVYKQHLEVVKLLAQNERTDLFWKNKEGMTIFHVAAGWGTTEILKFLSGTAAWDVNAKDSHDNSLLHYAAFTKNSDAVEMLLEREGIDIDVYNTQGMTPESLATFVGAIEVREMLSAYAAAQAAPAPSESA